MVVGQHGERLQQLAEAPVVAAAGQALPEGGYGESESAGVAGEVGERSQKR